MEQLELFPLHEWTIKDCHEVHNSAGFSRKFVVFGEDLQNGNTLRFTLDAQKFIYTLTHVEE